jgi:hypothetical protein
MIDIVPYAFSVCLPKQRRAVAQLARSDAGSMARRFLERED